MPPRFVWACLLLGLAKCSVARDYDADLACPDYEAEIAPLLAARCAGCHQSKATAASGYGIISRDEIWQRDEQGLSRIVPGDKNSLFLANAAGQNGHTALASEEQALLRVWIVDCQANSLKNEMVHPRGFINRASQDFHGHKIKEAAYDFGICEDCHGKSNAINGGRVGLSCLACHKEGPKSCNTCHGNTKTSAPPKDTTGNTSEISRGVGAHRAHLGAGTTISLSKTECQDCHLVPSQFSSPGHVFLADGSLDLPPAEVVLSAEANRSLKGLESRRKEPAAYDKNILACSNVYCHGGSVLGDTTIGRDFVWTDVRRQNLCEQCHGMPPSNHAAGMVLTECINCHAEVVDGQGAIINPIKHLDGELALGDGTLACTSCHGDGTSPAPDQGAHASHVYGGDFSSGYACATCHPVPTGIDFQSAVLASGHIDDSPGAEVFVRSASPFSLAFFDGATPSFDADTGTCSNGYCHGGGNTLKVDSAATRPQLSWRADPTYEAACGSCHGLPPKGIGHPPSNSSQCASCHSETVLPSGDIRFSSSGTTVHIDGVVNQ